MNEYALIPLENSNLTVKIDLSDLVFCKKYKWFLEHQRSGKFVCTYCFKTKEGKRNKYIHRILLGCSNGDGKIVDHINGDRLDNRRANLRICCNYQNIQNSKIYNTNKSGYKNICWDKNRKKWIVQIVCRRKTYSKGFENINDAVEYSNFLRNSLHGSFARTK